MPTICNFIYGWLFKVRILEDNEPQPRIWWRYIDDIFIWEHGEDSLNNLLKYFMPVKVRLRNSQLETDLHIKPTDTHQFLDSTSCHPCHCKKSIPYSQALRYNRICFDNEKFDQRCNDLEERLMERGYSERMVSTQILQARGESRIAFLNEGIPELLRVNLLLTYF